MFDFFFGWRKASKCKKLIRRLQCRLKLLKNKRCSIVRQLREDVAQLIGHGHHQIAFNRVEQIYGDENIVAVYDLLDHFCEFVIINLSYIRKNKDCPNDINEAVSSLIYASARFGDLPELLLIRKLFGERYGQRFAVAALELHPGNLVNHQVKESLTIKSVPDDVKYRLLDEIRSCLQPGPLALEFSSEAQQMAYKSSSSSDQVPNGDGQTKYIRDEESQLQVVANTEAKGKIVYVDTSSERKRLPMELCVDTSSESKRLPMEPCLSLQDSDTTAICFSFSTVLQASPNTGEPSMLMKEVEVQEEDSLNVPHEFTVSVPESSSESSAKLPEEIIYLDDIEELESPISRDGNFHDQRLFKFKSSIISRRGTFNDCRSEGVKEKYQSWNEKVGSKSHRKSRKATGKRLRNRSQTWESSGTTDTESALYYGDSCNNSPNHNFTSHHCRKHQRKIPMEEIMQKSYYAHERTDQNCHVKLGNNCSLEHPCYSRVCGSDWKSPSWKPKSRITTSQWYPTCDLKEENSQNLACHCQCFCMGQPNDQETRRVLFPQKPRRIYPKTAKMCDNLMYQNGQNNKLQREWNAEGWDHPASCVSSSSSSASSSVSSCSRGNSPWKRKETQPSYLRAMTMPPERPKDGCNDNILRSNSFPFEDSCHLSYGTSSSPHVHPKLPDYDELAAKFMALKKASLQRKHPQSNEQLSGV